MSLFTSSRFRPIVGTLVGASVFAILSVPSAHAQISASDNNPTPQTTVITEYPLVSVDVVQSALASSPVSASDSALVISQTRRKLMLDSTRLIASYSAPGNLPPAQLKAVDDALNALGEATGRQEKSYSELIEGKGVVSFALLNSNLSGSRNLRKAMIDAVRQIKTLPPGNVGQMQTKNTFLDNIVKLTDYLENVAPVLQKIRDQSFSGSRSIDVTTDK